MESLQRALDALIRDLRRGDIQQEHGFSILFFATGAAAARVLSGTYVLDSFAGRPIGQATLENVSIAARTSTYVQAVLLFLAVAVAGAIWLPRFTAWVGGGVARALEATSLCGLLCFVFAAWRVDMRGMMALLCGAQALIVVTAVLDRKLPRRLVATVRDRGAYVGWIGATGFALIVPITDFFWRPRPAFWMLPLAIVAFAFALDAVRRIACGLRQGDEATRARRSDRFLYALTPLAALAAASVVRNEIWLLCSQRGLSSIRPEHVELGFVALLLLWCSVRARRGRSLVGGMAEGRLDVERLIGRFTFPWVVCGSMAMMRFAFQQAPSPDFLEPANGGLMIQQWFDHGRIPFIETFGAHGLMDNFFGFVYAALSGARHGAWTHYDYWLWVLSAFVTYHVLRAWWSSPFAALFCMLALPRITALFPDYCVHAAVSVFVLQAVFTRRTATAWAGFAFWTVFVFAWRLDVGFANALASAGALAALVVLLPEHRPPIGAMVRGTLAAAVALCVLYLAACWSSGVDPVARMLDFKAVVTSNQAFGFAILARERNEIVLMHTFLVPILVMVAGVAMLVRMRGRADPRDPVFFALLGTAFFAGYYFANYPRGLVRHTFLEGGNVVMSSFAFLVLAGAWRWLLPEPRRLAAFGAFVITATLLAYELDFNAVKGRTQLAVSSQVERIALALRQAPRVTYQATPIDRVEPSPWYDAFAKPAVTFLDEELLQPGETFLDMSNSPLLYYHTRRRSPHWLNHVLLVYGERLQRRFLEELEQNDVPIVVMPSVPALAKHLALPDLHQLDGVQFSLRHYRLYEWVYARYEPARVVNRWPVWVRKDRLMTQPPRAAVPEAVNPPPIEMERKLFALDDARVAGNGAPAVHVPGPIDLAAGRACALRIVARAEPGVRLDVTMDIEGDEPADEFARSYPFPAGRHERWLWLPRAQTTRTLRDLALVPRGTFELEALELWEFDSPACRMIDEHVAAPESTEMRQLAWLWGSFDEETDEPPAILRTLAGAEVDGARGFLRSDGADDGDWARGIHRREAAIRLKEESAPVAVGERLQFPSSGVRTVTRVDGRVVHVDGAPLDPLRDGAPHVVRFVVADPAAGSVVLPRHPRTYPFEPLTAKERGTAGTYLRLRLRAADSKARATRMMVACGAAERGIGRFFFQLPDDDETHDYAVRLSVQYHWHTLDADWIKLVPEDGGVEVLGAWITAGD